MASLDKKKDAQYISILFGLYLHPLLFPPSLF